MGFKGELWAVMTRDSYTGYGAWLDLMWVANKNCLSFRAVILEEVLFHPDLYLLLTRRDEDGDDVGEAAEVCVSDFMYSCVSSA